MQQLSNSYHLLNQNVYTVNTTANDMDKKDFANSLLCEEIIERILQLPHLDAKQAVIRIIKDHDDRIDLMLSDFYPSIMERNGGKMPKKEVQIRKTSLTQFGTSFYLDNDYSIEIIQSVPSLREEMKAIAYGTISKTHGLIGKPDSTGHLILYMLNPLKNNLPETFKYRNKEE